MDLERQINEAELLKRAIIARQMALSLVSWDIERVLHNLRLNKIGASGIQHRVIQDRTVLLEQLSSVVNAAKVALDKKV